MNKSNTSFYVKEGQLNSLKKDLYCKVNESIIERSAQNGSKMKVKIDKNHIRREGFMPKNLSFRAVCVFLISLFFSGCVSLRTYEKHEYKDLEYRLSQVGLEPDESKSPVLAGVLNLLPGIGNAYLEQWGPFVGNLLLWPWSVIWGVPQAVIDAHTINKKETLYYYQFGPGKGKLDNLEKQKGVTEPNL